MTTVCLLHGAWHDSSCWAPVVGALEARGHEAVAPDLPLHDPRASFAERIAPALEALAGARAPVVVGHSLGSSYAALIAAARPCSLVVHLCPRLGPFAEAPGAPRMFRAGFPFPPDRADGTSVWDPDTAVAAMYGRLDPATARALARRLRPMGPPAGRYPLARHPDVPTALVYAAEDEFFEPAWERFMARALGIEPIEIAGGHFPMAEDPRALAELLDRLIRERATGRLRGSRGP